jgi:hypothetical protein
MQISEMLSSAANGAEKVLDQDGVSWWQRTRTLRVRRGSFSSLYFDDAPHADHADKGPIGAYLDTVKFATDFAEFVARGSRKRSVEPWQNLRQVRHLLRAVA